MIFSGYYTYDLDCLSFFEVKTIVKKFGYQLGDVIYYREYNKELDDGLVLITFDDDVVRMAECILEHKLVVLYTVSFAHDDYKVCTNVGEVEEDEGSDDEERMRIFIDDPYWQSLMSRDDDAWDDGGEPVASTSTYGDDTSIFGDGDGGDNEDGDGDGGDEDDGDKEAGDGDCGHGGDGHEEAGDEHSEVIEQETAHVGGSRHLASFGGRMLKDQVSSNLGRSDILVTPPKSDEENEVGSRPSCVTRISEFHDADMEDHKLVVGMTFTLVNQFRQAVREYNLFRRKDVQFIKNDGDRVNGVCRSKSDGCPWRFYDALVLGELTFMLKSLNPTY
jgi:hypothetical protein